MHTENIRQVALTSMAGSIFIASALLAVYFGPWFYTSPQVPLQFPLLIWGLFPTDILLKLSVIGIIFAALIGLSQKWWWGIVICICLVFLEFLTTFNSFSLNALIFSLFLMLFLCILTGLLRFTTQFPSWINPSRKIVRHFIELAMVLILIGSGLFVGRLISIFFDGPVLFLNTYKTIQTRNWQIRNAEILPNLLGDYYQTIRFYLSNGSTKDCLYDHFLAEEYSSDHIFDFTNIGDAQNVIICSD